MSTQVAGNAVGGRLRSAGVFVCLAWLVLLTLYLAGRPLDTGDLWWHLKLGELFSDRGPWIEMDPLVHTAVSGGPSPHEWLFQVALHGLNSSLGFYGLRLTHLLWVAGILALAYALLLRQAASHTLAALGCGVFIQLSWYRLFQLRPDLVSIPACFLFYRLLLAGPRPPDAKRIAAALLVLLIWANAHPLFAIGPAMLVAALLGIALNNLLARWGAARGRLPEGVLVESDTAATAGRLGLSLLLSLGVSAINPRGFEQLLTFLRSAQADSLWTIGDEWTAFDPFAFGHYVAGSLSLPMFVAMDALLLLFLVAVAWRFWRYLALPERQRLADFDAVHFGLAVASIVAILISIRFLWMSLFPLLYLVQTARLLGREAPGWQHRLSWTAAVACVALALSYPTNAGLKREAARPRGYLSTPYVWQGYSLGAVQFLLDTGVEGNLFNEYGMGGFLGYWLAPPLRVFLDSRLESPPGVLTEYALINAQLGGRRDQSFLHLLERREVDFFLGRGLPTAPTRVNRAQYTTAHLENVPGWVLVFRGYDQSVYLRQRPRNADNLARISSYYARQQVPFDELRGLDVAQVIEANPQWAAMHGLIPLHHSRVLAQLESGRAQAGMQRALGFAGLALTLAGDYTGGAEFDERAHAAAPALKAPLQRLVFDYLHLGRPKVALAAAEALVAIAGDDPRSRHFYDVALQFKRAGAAAEGFDPALAQQLSSLPIVVGQRMYEHIEARYRVPPPLRR